MAERDVTLQEAAEFLGVHYMTAYRYVRLGLLPARKEGATWRVDRADLDEFRADGDGGSVASPKAPGSRKRAPWAERLESRLIAGDHRGAWGVIEAALAAGTELDAVYLDVIAPAMAAIGERWERGELDIAVEHRATGIALRLIGRLGPRFARRGRTRGTVVLGAPAGERHSLPLAMLADLVRAAGFEVSDLGADVPAGSFALALRDVQRLVAVGIGVATPESLVEVAPTIAAIREVAPDVPIVLGGRACTSEAQARALGATGWAPDGRAAVALFDQLAGRRRGAVMLVEPDELDVAEEEAAG